MQERIIELEKKLAYLEHTLDELNQVLIHQQNRMDNLTRELKQVKEQTASGSYIKKPEEENPPPHY